GLATLLLGTGAHAAPTRCRTPDYDVKAKASVRALLKARYGDAYAAFDIDYPTLVDEVGGSDVVVTARGKRLNLRGREGRFGWRGFRRKKPAPSGIPESITVGFDMCSNEAIGILEE